MVEIITSNKQKGNLLETFYFLGAIICLLIAILGIKFKWFKRRLDLQQLPTNNGGERRNREQRNDDILSQGVFRRRFEDDIITETDIPKTLPPIRINGSGRDFSIPVPHKVNPRPISQPIRPTIPPPIDIPRSKSSGTLTNVRLEDTLKNGDTNGIPQRSFRKKDAQTKKLFSKYDSRNNSTNDEQITRRPTGLGMPPDDTFARNYSEGFGLPKNSSTTRCEIELVQSQEEHFVVLAEDKESEVNLLEKIKIPKPEPRTMLAVMKSEKDVQYTAHSKDGTEA